jgi:tetratricopeptide (TPR) repeat protein
VWRAYLPHALRLLESGRCSIEEKARLCLSVGRCLRFDGRIREAVRWLEESYRWRKALDEDDSNRLLSQHVLTGAYQAHGHVQKAIELLETVIAVHIRVLAQEHPSRLASQYELARAYRADGQTQEAVQLLESVVAVKPLFLRDNDPLRLVSLRALTNLRAELSDRSDEDSQTTISS